MIDAEKALRDGDPRRVAKLREGAIPLDEFKASLKSRDRSEARILPISMNPYR